ncbi:hypothetical protein GE061_005813 [Apolygus lucorum]|uniref:DUF7041 domain-containing protein n=1 Tax=Apolygus lucorum TaxID=248454 RepID=A0A8S9X1B3_APOLU|nr:hypothetical protein GE061_005813 [Apolygus lucorum]
MSTARQREILRIKKMKKKTPGQVSQISLGLSSNPIQGSSEQCDDRPDRQERPRPPKLPQFAKQNVKLWFAQCDALFRTARMVEDDDKYSCIVGVLEMDVAEQVQRLVVDPPIFGKYEALKAELILKFSDSLSEKQDKLASMELGTNKPSYLLTQMQAIGLDLVSEAYLRNLWLRRLPDPLRTVLAATNEPLVELAAKADELAALNDNRRVASLQDVGTSALGFNAEDQIARLTAQVAALRTQILVKPKNEKEEEIASGWCRFHRQFRDKAFKCLPPCSFPKNA